MKPHTITRWGLLIRSHNRLDGLREHLDFADGLPLLFLTRKAARAFSERHYAYMRERKDLRAEPHGWLMPRPVRVTVTVETAT